MPSPGCCSSTSTRCCSGGDEFYEQIFRSIGVPYEAVRWRRDTNPSDHDAAQLHKQMQVSTLINMHRVRGHLIADLDPLSAKPPEMHPELDPATYGLTIWDLDREFLTGGDVGIYAPVGGTRRLPLGEILHVLRDAYCRTVGIEYMHIQEPEEKRWIQEQVEGAPTKLPVEDQRHILAKLNAAEALEKFLATKYLGQKRFGLEGAESLIPILDTILEQAADQQMDSAVLGMSHRGRLNVLANIVGKSYAQLFREFEGYVDPDSIQGSGDVKYHLGQEGAFVARSGTELPVSLAANPSHLEAVNPVVEGMARARMDQIPHDPARRFPVLPMLMHGDAAFAGQGVVAETLNLSLIKGYRVGGTIHVIVNNQLGFTTPPESARSSEYCTDVAKAVQAPILHVNGDDPEACVRVARLAFAYRQRFHKDVVIDMVCYRRHGHNEGDDPSYTQPQMYRTIEQLRSVRKLFVESLVRRGDFSMDEAEQALSDFQARLQQALDETRQAKPGRGVPGGAAPAQPGRAAPHADRGRRVRAASASTTRCPARPTASACTPSWPGSSMPATRCSRRVRSTGRSPRRSPSARCWPRGPRSAWPARTAGAAPSRIVTRPCSTTTTARSSSRSPSSRSPRTPSCGSTTRCSASTRRSASSTATR